MSAFNGLNVAPNNEVLTVSNSLIEFPLTLPATIAGGDTTVINKFSPLLYPTVGESYLVNLNPVLSADFNSAPTAGTLGIILAYANSDYTVSYVSASSYKVIATGTIGTVFGFNTSLSLVFTHTDPTNRLYIVIDNLTSNSIAGATSVLNVDCGIVNLGTRTKTITAADFI
jgi:hypothetical protein